MIKLTLVAFLIEMVNIFFFAFIDEEEDKFGRVILFVILTNVTTLILYTTK